MTLREHMPLAMAVADRFVRQWGRSISPDDIRQAARIGLWEALRRHVPDSGPFRGYAVKCIRSRIIDETRRQGWGSRYNPVQVSRFADMGVDADGSHIPDNASVSPEDATVARLDVELALTAQMPERSRTILKMQLAGTSARRIAENLNISEPRVFQIMTATAAAMGDHIASGARRQESTQEEPPVKSTLPEEGIDLNAELARYQSWLVSQALIRAMGNRTKAARLLRIKRTTLVMMLKSESERPKPPVKCGAHP